MENITKKLKIAVIIKRFIATGGAERYAVEVTKRLAIKHEVHVFSQIWDDDVEKIIFHKIKKFVNKPTFINQLLFSYLTKRAIDDSFDIIHTHERITKFDVLTIHCPCYKGFITEKKGFWAKLGVYLSVMTSPRDLAYLWLEKKQFSYNKNRLLIPVSKLVKNDVQANYRLPETFFKIAYPGVNMRFDANEKFRETLRSKLNIEKDCIVVLFVGTEFKRKGLKPLLKGFAELKNPAAYKLLIAGGGDKKRYHSITKKLGIDKSVVFLGLVKKIEQIYSIADIFILPTLSDPSPMAPIEAMSFKIATIISGEKYAGCAEHIKNQEALILDDPNDYKKIARLIEKLYDSSFRDKIREKGYNLAKNLTWDKTTKDTLEAYLRILKQKNAKAKN